MKKPVAIESWFQTYSGVKFSHQRCTQADIRIEDIAHALSNYPRFGGHARYFYSVGQHCCLVHDHMPNDSSSRSRMLRLQGLIHDGTEAYLGDVVKPLKNILPDYQKLERRLEAIIMLKYGLPTRLKPEVKAADLTALATEKRDLLYGGPIWESIQGVVPWTEEIVPWLPSVAKEQFLKRFNALT